jgi:hypothetical protein
MRLIQTVPWDIARDIDKLQMMSERCRIVSLSQKVIRQAAG